MHTAHDARQASGVTAAVGAKPASAAQAAQGGNGAAAPAARSAHDTRHGERHFHHPLPVIGYPEAYYAKHIHQADQAGDKIGHEAYKVGQYITCGLEPNRKWVEKLKYFCHALKHHTTPPAGADEPTKEYFHKLSDMVRRHAGHEALRLARHENDTYSVRLHAGTAREALEEEAEVFFSQLLGHAHACPEWCTKEVWQQITHIRDHWI